MATPTVLIADNDSVIRSVVRSLLAKVGRQADCAASSEEAVELARGRPYDLVILDVDMPHAGGLAACGALRRIDAYSHVPIAMLTALDNVEIRARCSEAGATLFIAKPFNPASLMRQLEPRLRLGPTQQSQLAELVATDRGLRLQDSQQRRRCPP